ncbi:hypothetical protein A3K87_09905 [Variovorax paradoxus]|uniref:Phage tail protein n=1 Tax=Variovorax paradoxus TaxID=34073 RepID=A0AA91DTH0_VARPD|nr:hypothetical protein [Variovorax paradoxus]OAK66070.1 hypothetical protein A3K87_09905 [Variovorax paradoxus]
MFAIDDATAVAVMPTPEAAGTAGYFTEGNPALGVAATYLRASFLNGLMQELLNVLAGAGVAPSKTTYNQILTALRTNALITATDTGAANACVLTYAPAIAALTDGMVLWFKAAAANTGATTLNVNGLGAKPIVGGGQVALQGGEIIANGKCMVVYSTTLSSFVLIECTGAALQVASSTQSGHAVQRNQATIGATVRSVNGSRSLGVTYTNSTSRFMWVYISAIASTAGSNALSATVAGIGYIGASTNGATALSGYLAFPVPPGASYQVNAATGGFSAFNNWIEVS